MLPIRDTLEFKGHIHVETEGMGKDMPCKWKPKYSKSGHNYIQKSSLSGKKKTVIRKVI